MTFWTCFPVFCFFFFFTSLIRWPSLAFVSSLGTGPWPQKKMLFHLLVLECARTSNESNDSFSTIWHVRPTPWGQELMGLGLGVRLSRYPDIPRSFAKAPDGLQGAARLHYTWLEADYRIWNQLFWIPVDSQPLPIVFAWHVWNISHWVVLATRNISSRWRDS